MTKLEEFFNRSFRGVGEWLVLRTYLGSDL